MQKLAKCVKHAEGAHLVSQEPSKPQITAACASFRPLSIASMMTCASLHVITCST